MQFPLSNYHTKLKTPWTTTCYNSPLNLRLPLWFRFPSKFPIMSHFSHHMSNMWPPSHVKIPLWHYWVWRKENADCLNLCLSGSCSQWLNQPHIETSSINPMRFASKQNLVWILLSFEAFIVVWTPHEKSGNLG